MGALSYALASITALALTGVAITGASTTNRTANIIIFLLCNQLAELPFTVMLMDACFYTWLNLTGVFLPYWVQKEQLSAQVSDGWESVIDMSLDVYRPNVVQGGDDRPVFFYVHGGGWTQGSKSMVGPIVTEMVSHEWIVVSVDYRLKAKAGYPTQLVDCKRALRWVKDEIQTFGGNPNNIIVGGDSSGGQLAAMLALTQNLPEFQPGFEQVDTSVQGCCAMSSVLDLVDLNNYHRTDGRTRFIKEVAHREGAAESSENVKFLTEHSPLFRIESTRTPFLVVHVLIVPDNSGDLDIISPVQAARDFVSAFKSKSNATIHYLEIPGGNHGFHMLSSPRSWYTIIAIAEWLNHTFDRRGAMHSTEKKKKVHELVEWGWD
ncbi:hypothetical protein BG004_003068 [Podila humilis]|nr:hypothetical protein BG004_003068 [Podila humilis]